MINKLITFSFLFFITISVSAQKDPVYNTKSGAIEGYDAVAYFDASKAVKGSDKFKLDWNGFTWYFTSSENLTKFEKSPETYAPEFGGYCAYAVSQGYTYKSDPEAWKIVNGKLYLNYSKKIQQKWEKDEVSFIKLGEVNWPKVIEK